MNFPTQVPPFLLFLWCLHSDHTVALNVETLGELGDPHSLNDPTPMGTPRYPH